MESKKTSITSFRLPTEVYEQLKKEAEKESRTLNNMLLVIIKEYFEKKD